MKHPPDIPGGNTMRPEKHISDFMKSVKLKASARLDSRVHSGIDQALAESQQTIKVHTEPNRRSILMRSPIMKLAAAAVVAIVAIVLIPPMLGGKPAIAEVIRPLLYARTVAFDYIVGDEAAGPVIHDVVADNVIRRTFSNMPVILVIDLDNQKMLTLDPVNKGATYVDIGGQLVQGTQSVISLVRDVVRDVADHPEQVQDLGERQIGGHSTVGFQIKDPHSMLQIWADKKTATPVRIEMSGDQSTMIFKNIEFDVPVEPSLVSMDVPAGYTVAKSDMKMGDFTEEDFIEGLRVWAQVLNDGVFPDQISAAAVMQLMPELGQKLDAMGASKEEGMKMGMAVGKIPGFLMILDHQGEWHYAGKGVTLGDADAAVFWYRRGDAKTYRVIYGDLHVEDVDLDHLPK
jgi:hypothetical protein